MTTVFDPRKHLTQADMERLEAKSKSLGLKVGEYIEIAIKQSLFAFGGEATLKPQTNRPA